MRKVLKKSLVVVLLCVFASNLSACRTTRDERLMIGTALGAGIGAGLAVAGDEEIYAGIAVGAACGAILGFLSEDL